MIEGCGEVEFNNHVRGIIGGIFKLMTRSSIHTSMSENLS